MYSFTDSLDFKTYSDSYLYLGSLNINLLAKPETIRWGLTTKIHRGQEKDSEDIIMLSISSQVCADLCICVNTPENKKSFCGCRISAICTTTDQWKTHGEFKIKNLLIIIIIMNCNPNIQHYFKAAPSKQNSLFVSSGIVRVCAIIRLPKNNKRPLQNSTVSWRESICCRASRAGERSEAWQRATAAYIGQLRSYRELMKLRSLWHAVNFPLAAIMSFHKRQSIFISSGCTAVLFFTFWEKKTYVASCS